MTESAMRFVQSNVREFEIVFVNKAVRGIGHVPIEVERIIRFF